MMNTPRLRDGHTKIAQQLRGRPTMVTRRVQRRDCNCRLSQTTNSPHGNLGDVYVRTAASGTNSRTAILVKIKLIIKQDIKQVSVGNPITIKNKKQKQNKTEKQTEPQKGLRKYRQKQITCIKQQQKSFRTGHSKKMIETIF